MSEKQVNYSIVFIDVFIWGIGNQNLTLQTYYKSTYIGLLWNFKSFTLFSHKISLIKCLIDRSFKIFNNWNPFHEDIETLNLTLLKTHIHHSLFTILLVYLFVLVVFWLLLCYAFIGLCSCF